jgi:pyruvate dehydrogenase E1 component alpha subunit
VLEALRLMMVGRAFDTKCFSLQRQGKMGTFAPLHGQEASIVGSAMALNPATDWIAPQYREMPAALRQGLPLKNIILYRQGHPDGGVIPEGVNVMQFQISLAAQIPHAVGLAWGMRLQQQNGVAVAYFGDGSSSEGDFHESCNRCDQCTGDISAAKQSVGNLHPARNSKRLNRPCIASSGLWHTRRIR